MIFVLSLIHLKFWVCITCVSYSEVRQRTTNIEHRRRLFYVTHLSHRIKDKERVNRLSFVSVEKQNEIINCSTHQVLPKYKVIKVIIIYILVTLKKTRIFEMSMKVNLSIQEFHFWRVFENEMGTKIHSYMKNAFQYVCIKCNAFQDFYAISKKK